MYYLVGTDIYCGYKIEKAPETLEPQDEIEGIFIIENWWNSFIDRNIIGKNFRSFLIVMVYPILMFGLVVLLFFDVLTLGFNNSKSPFVYNEYIISHLMLGLSATLLYHLLILPQAHSRPENGKNIVFKNTLEKMN